MNQSNIKLFIDGKEILIPSKNDTPKNFRKNKIERISFFRNFIGRVSSVIFFSYAISPKLINYFKEEIKEGFYKNKILYKFFISNDNNYLKNAINFKYNEKYKSKIKEKLINISLKEKNSKNLISIFCPFTNVNNSTIDDIFGNYIAELSKNDGINNYINNFKNIEIIGGINDLLPISELILKYKNILIPKEDESILIKYFLIIKDIILSHNRNFINANKNYFFSNVSLFLEKYPNEFFDDKLLKVLIDIGKEIFQINNNEIMLNYYNDNNDNYIINILLNENIFSKFSSENQIKLWQEINKFFASDYLLMKEYLNIYKIIDLIRFYDKDRYTHFCCKKHANLIINKQKEKIMEPDMNKKTEKLFELIYLYMSRYGDYKETKNLYKLLILDLSPCLQKRILQVYINYFDNNRINDKMKELTLDNLYNSNLVEINEYLLTVSLLDVHFKVFKLFQIIFQNFPYKSIDYFRKYRDKIKFSNFFEFLGENLLLKNIYIEVDIKNLTDDTGIKTKNIKNEISTSPKSEKRFKRSNSLKLLNNLKRNTKFDNLFISNDNEPIIKNKKKVSIMKYINKDTYKMDKKLLWNLLLSWMHFNHNNLKKKKFPKINDYLLNLSLNFFRDKDIWYIENFLITLNSLFQNKDAMKHSEIHLNQKIFFLIIKIIFYYHNKENTKNIDKKDEKCIENIKNKSIDIFKILVKMKNNEEKNEYEKCIQFIFEYSLYIKNEVDQEKIKEIDKKKKKNEIFRITSIILLRCCENSYNYFNLTARICFNYLINYKNTNFIFNIKKETLQPPSLLISNQINAKTLVKNDFTFLNLDIISDYNKNKKEKYTNIFNKNKDSIMPNFILEGINYTSFFKEDNNIIIDNNPNNKNQSKVVKNYLLKEIWRDFQLYDYIIDYYYSNLWGLENLCKLVKIEYDNNINILMKKLLKEYTNKNNKNILINNIKDCFGFNIS